MECRRTPAPFSGLGANAIDGRGPGEDQTPRNRLNDISAVAIDESGGATDGDIYVAQGPFPTSPIHLVDIFASSGKYLGTLTEFKQGPNASGPSTPFNDTCGLTVDPAGDLYVGDTTAGPHADAVLAIHKFHPTADPLSNADASANFGGDPQKDSTNTYSCPLAAGAGPSAGYIFSFGNGGTAFGAEPEVFKIDATTGARLYPFKDEVLQEKELKEVNLRRAQTISVDPSTGYVFVGVAGGRVYEYDASGSNPPLPRFAFQVAGPGVTVQGGEVDGLAVNASGGHLYIAGKSGSHIYEYGASVIVPDVATESASEITGLSATLNGRISAANGAPASCHFQYTTEAAYLADQAIAGHDGFAGSSSAPCATGPFNGSSTNPASATVTGLAAETLYRFRIVGESSIGPEQGDTEAFETLGAPQIKGGTASQITPTGALISGEVNPRGLPTTFAVQYLTQAEFEAGGYAAPPPAPPSQPARASNWAPSPCSSADSNRAPPTTTV